MAYEQLILEMPELFVPDTGMSRTDWIRRYVWHFKTIVLEDYKGLGIVIGKTGWKENTLRMQIFVEARDMVWWILAYRKSSISQSSKIIARTPTKQGQQLVRFHDSYNIPDDFTKIGWGLTREQLAARILETRPSLASLPLDMQPPTTVGEARKLLATAVERKLVSKMPTQQAIWLRTHFGISTPLLVRIVRSEYQPIYNSLKKAGLLG